jgi:1-acyl-sn-glycerol-3-phosphate acyltransferase
MLKDSKTELMADMRIYQNSTRIFKLGLILWNRIKIYGADNIPDKGGVMIVSNHASYLDPPIIGVAYRKRPVHFMARDSLWKRGFGAWWMDGVGCIPVKRDEGDIRAIKLAIKSLQEGKVISIFPEGTRSDDGNLQSAKSGIGLIIEKSECNVIPAYIDGSFQALPKGAKWIKPHHISISFGLPLSPDTFKSLGKGRKAYSAYVSFIMDRIKCLRDTE